MFYDVDIFGHGALTASRFLPPGVDPRKLTGELPVSMTINQRILGEPAFKKFYPEWVDKYIEAIHKVAEHHNELHTIKKNTPQLGGIALTKRKN